MFTGRGDDGTSSLFGQSGRLPKTAAIFSALGALDELNSWLGVCKTLSQSTLTPTKTPAEPTLTTCATFPQSSIAPVTIINAQIELIPGYPLPVLLHFMQEQLFTIQAALAGAHSGLTPEPVQLCEQVITTITQQLPPIKSFLIPGGTILAAHLDFARAIARRAELAVWQALASESTTVLLSPASLAFLNRLSSLLYALTRWVNQQQAISELAPTYQHRQ